MSSPLEKLGAETERVRQWESKRERAKEIERKKPSNVDCVGPKQFYINKEKISSSYVTTIIHSHYYTFQRQIEKFFLLVNLLCKTKDTLRMHQIKTRSSLVILSCNI